MAVLVESGKVMVRRERARGERGRLTTTNHAALPGNRQKINKPSSTPMIQDSTPPQIQSMQRDSIEQWMRCSTLQRGPDAERRCVQNGEWEDTEREKLSTSRVGMSRTTHRPSQFVRVRVASASRREFCHVDSKGFARPKIILKEREIEIESRAHKIREVRTCTYWTDPANHCRIFIGDARLAVIND